jgi:hypothetical protein
VPPVPPTPEPDPATSRYVSPEGKTTNRGTREEPWPIAAALEGKLPVLPGQTLYLAAGTYRAPDRRKGSTGYHVLLQGTAEKPIEVRPVPGARVIIDGGLSVQPPGAYVHLRDLEVLVSEPRAAAPVPAGAQPDRPWGGINISGTPGIRLIHCVIHDCSQGVSWWQDARGGELYGCLIYRNGWQGTARAHGHGIYTQNQGEVKSIRDCLMWDGFSYSLHAYGEQGEVRDYLAEGNVSWNNGGQFLLGGKLPSVNITVRSNVCYDDQLKVGYSSDSSEDCTVTDNLVILDNLSITGFKAVKASGNRVYGELPKPFGPEVILRPSASDPSRANLVTVQTGAGETVSVDLSAFVKAGERFRLLDPANLWGAPVLEGVGPMARVPVRGQFTVYVVRKG